MNDSYFNNSIKNLGILFELTEISIPERRNFSLINPEDTSAGCYHPHASGSSEMTTGHCNGVKSSTSECWGEHVSARVVCSTLDDSKIKERASHFLVHR